MTKQTEALRLALEALENAQANVGEWWPEAITAIREALSEESSGTERPAHREPLTDEMEIQSKRHLGPHRRSAFRDGWRSAEAAHGIKVLA